MNKTYFFFIGFLLFHSITANAQLAAIRAQFPHPPDQYRPGVYWYFMDGNMSAETITKDLESMKEAGIGHVVFLEVNVGVPRGKVEFLSEQWKELFKHAEQEARRLGIEMTLGIGPGWTGSGGPWVRANESMQHLVASRVTVKAGDAPIVLPVPPPKKPFFGEGGLSPEVKKEWASYYQDVAVLAFPTNHADTLSNTDEKALYYRAPYSSGTVRPELPSPSSDTSEKRAIKKAKIIDLTDKMRPDGSLNWSPPSGEWTVMRFVSRNNGAITRPAPVPGLGLEADKFDTLAIRHHLDNYIGALLTKIKMNKSNEHTQGGLTRLHIDSWEMGAQNWTARFREAFIKRRGYDPQPYYPVYAGRIVGSAAESERFLWDLRQTSAELILANHAEYVKAYAKKHGLSLSIEPYDMTPLADLDLGSVADVPMGEFWSKGFGFNSTYSVIEATSIGHIEGKSLIPAEAFTAQNNEGWKQHPASMKNQGDWAFAAGINRFVYHTFQNQFLPDSLKPGATMGPYGVHWDRGQTWWPMVRTYHDYVTRSQFLLQQGRTVADVLYLTPEGSPQVFVPPASAILGDTIGDRRGYNFDGCSPNQLMAATVENHMLAFPSGARYRLLVLPICEVMTPELLAKIGTLLKQGATIIGNPPLRSPSLSNYPDCDHEVTALSQTIWGTNTIPKQLVLRKYGQGKLFWGEEIINRRDKLYPHYELTSRILQQQGVQEDFSANEDLRYTHRTGNNWDIYFVSNKTDKLVETVAQFRAVQGSPEFWNAATGEIKKVTSFKIDGSSTSVPIRLAAYESVFVVFSKANNWKSTGLKTPTKFSALKTLDGPWHVSFDPKWGGPVSTTFDRLTDWSKNQNPGIKYYSGKALYQQRFTLNKKPEGKIYLDLGEVNNMARITLNGKDLGVVWTAPWQVDISEVVKTGDNDLKIEVINLWVNRLIGDEQKPDDGIKDGQWPEWLLKGQPRTSGRYTFTSTDQYDADSPLLPSGLLGPVTLRIKTEK